MSLTAYAMAGILVGFIVMLVGFIMDERQHPPRRHRKKALRHKTI